MEKYELLEKILIKLTDKIGYNHSPQHFKAFDTAYDAICDLIGKDKRLTPTGEKDDKDSTARRS